MRAGRHINALLKLPVLGVLLRLLSSGMYVVRGGSMSPALRPGDGVLASGAGYLGSPPARGDIVVIRETPVGGRRTIKRVVGLPSERVRFAEGVLYVDDAPLDEPYLGGLPHTLGLEEQSWTLGGADYFVLGDNRAHSTDSRTLGAVHRSRIMGKVWLRYWPPGRWGRAS